MKKCVSHGWKLNLVSFASLLLVVWITSGLLSCSKDGNGDDQETLAAEIGNIPGLGSQSGELQGTPFNLPEGVSVVGEIKGGWCDDSQASIGSGYLVTVCVTLRNDSDQGKTVTFPAGLILISSTDQFQHGVVLKDETIEIPPNETVRFAFFTYCGNNARSAASSSAVYTFGPITNSKLIARLINDLKNKKIDVVDYMDGDEPNLDYIVMQTDVQTLLWLITDGHELDWMSFEQAYQALLDEIPNS